MLLSDWSLPCFSKSLMELQKTFFFNWGRKQKQERSNTPDFLGIPSTVLTKIEVEVQKNNKYNKWSIEIWNTRKKQILEVNNEDPPWYWVDWLKTLHWKYKKNIAIFLLELLHENIDFTV